MRVDQQARIHWGDLDRFLREASEFYSQPPHTFAGISKRVLKVAYRLADGDWHRCVTEDGVTIIVLNNPAW